MKWAVVDGQGFVAYVAEAPDGQEMRAPEGLVAHPMEQALPPCPHPMRRLHWPTMAWVEARDLQVMRQEKRAEIGRWRAQQDRLGFLFDGHRVACDPDSRGYIDAVNGEVALTGALPQDFPGFWRADDNTAIPITDAGRWRQFYQAMVAQGAANFRRSTELKARLDRAQTAEEVDLITWDE